MALFCSDTLEQGALIDHNKVEKCDTIFHGATLTMILCVLNAVVILIVITVIRT